jgi:Uma2 family endonuclease
MSANLPATLHTAIGVFQGGPDWTVEVAVPNFPTQEDAQAYAAAFRVRLAEGKLYRDDGKGVDIFDDSGRDVLDSQITVFRAQAGGAQAAPVQMPVAQWSAEPGLSEDLKPVAWRVQQDSI